MKKKLCIIAAALSALSFIAVVIIKIKRRRIFYI